MPVAHWFAKRGIEKVTNDDRLAEADGEHAHIAPALVADVAIRRASHDELGLATAGPSTLREHYNYHPPRSSPDYRSNTPMKQAPSNSSHQHLLGAEAYSRPDLSMKPLPLTIRRKPTPQELQVKSNDPTRLATRAQPQEVSTHASSGKYIPLHNGYAVKILRPTVYVAPKARTPALGSSGISLRSHNATAYQPSLTSLSTSTLDTPSGIPLVVLRAATPSPPPSPRLSMRAWLTEHEHRLAVAHARRAGRLPATPRQVNVRAVGEVEDRRTPAEMSPGERWHVMRQRAVTWDALTGAQ